MKDRSSEIQKRREEKKDEKINVTFFYSVESSWIVAPVSTWYDLALALTFPITEYWMPPCLPVFREINSKQEFVNKKTKKVSWIFNVKPARFNSLSPIFAFLNKLPI